MCTLTRWLRNQRVFTFPANSWKVFLICIKKKFMKSLVQSIPNLIIVLFLTVVSNIALGQNRVIREINSFDQVKVSDNINVVFKKADMERITLVAEGIGYDKIVTESSGRELIIRMKTGIFRSGKVNVEVEYVKLRSIEAANQASIHFQDTIVGDELIVKATGGAEIKLGVDLAALKVSLSNGGKIEIAGKSKLQEVEASLAAKYNGYELKTENGYVKSNTNSEVVVWVTNRLEASAGSAAELKYRGKPEEVQSSSSLGGKIIGDI